MLSIDPWKTKNGWHLTAAQAQATDYEADRA